MQLSVDQVVNDVRCPVEGCRAGRGHVCRFASGGTFKDALHVDRWAKAEREVRAGRLALPPD